MVKKTPSFIIELKAFYNYSKIQKQYFVLLLFFLFTNSRIGINAQIVINEVLPPNTVELKNIGTSAVDVSSYWLCDFPSYAQISNSNIQCGNLIMEPGDILTIDDFSFVGDNVDGEFGLYSTSGFASSSAILDYVEWGSSGHGRSSVAVGAGIWSTGDFAPSFASGSSLEYDGSGDASSDWSEATTPSICNENTNATECTITVNDISLEDGTTTTNICVDGVGDPLNVTTNGGTDGTESGWIITDDMNNILALPMAPPFDLDGAGDGTCLIWYALYEAGLTGLEVDNNVSDLEGCFGLSNPVTVIRESADGGMISLLDGTTTYTGTAGDIVFDVMHTTNASNLAYWYIITDADDNILAFQNSLDGNTLDLSVAPPGECHIWGYSSLGLVDPVAGENISTLADEACESISSNFITVIREATECAITVNDISLEDGTTTTNICVDGVGDPLNVTTNGGTDGTESGWIITDDMNNILALPMAPPFDLDGAGDGTCLIWYALYEAGLTGLEVDNNVSDLEGCFGLSNPVTVIRESADGGMISLLDGTTTYTGTAGDIVFDVMHTTNAANLAYWYIITDADDNILAFQNSLDGNTLDLSVAPPGECHIWGYSSLGLVDPVAGENISTLADEACESISSNFITVIREATECAITVNDISLEDGTTTTNICVDGVGDPLNVTTNGGTDGTESGWIITDDMNNILALPMTPPFDLDGAGDGTCLIWYALYEAGLTGLEVDNNVSDLEGCFGLSNPITVIRESADGGMISLLDGTTTYTGTAGDIVFDVMHTTNAANLAYWYIITDADDNILAFQNSLDGNTLDLSVAPPGECHIWGYSSLGLVDPVAGENISTLADEACESISSNFITVIREATECNITVNDISLEDGTTTTNICVDGVGDPLNVTTNGGTDGTESGWIITDDMNNILALPMTPPFDLDGAGDGTCLIWYVLYEAGLTGLEVDNNVSDLEGCFGLSNPVTVIRESADGGMISLLDGTTTYTGTAGDIVFDVMHTTNAANLAYWYIITDADDNILAFQNSLDGNTLDLSVAPPGECHVWGYSSLGLVDPVAGENISTIADEACESISSNFITVIREATECAITVNDISLEDGTTTTNICVDGVGDPLNVTTNGGTDGTESGWIITDDMNNILALPMAPPFDLDGAGDGTCLIWYALYEAGLTGLEVDNNVSDLEGCFGLSNPVTVIRESADGGMISLLDGTTTYTGTAGDIVFDVMHTTNAANLAYWYIITDADDNILAFQNSLDGNTLDLSVAPPGECHIWGYSSLGLVDPVAGENISTLADEACESISSNFITVIREATECAITVNDISLEDGTTTTNICVDGVGDPLNVTTNGGTDGTESGWIITDDMNNILALPMAPPFDLDGAGDGTCLIWYVLYEAGLTGLEVDNNVSDLVGCFGLSNPVTVIRESADGGMISLLDGTTTYTGTAGDIVFDVMHTTNAANLAYWYIITDADDNILAFQNSLDGNTLDLSVAPPGECHVWGYSSLGLVDPVAGENISTLADEACESISSNFITVIREATECNITVNDISLEDGTTTTNICVDGVGDPLNVTTNGGTDGTESGWIITDDMNNILALPMAPPFDLDGAGDGTCLIWYVLYEAGLTGLEVDNNVSDLVGCFGLSNPVTVIRESADGGMISLLDGTTTYTGTAGDIVFDVMHTTNASNLAYWYIITDADDNILAFQNSLDGNTLDLSVAPPGECHIWGYSSLGLVDPVAGENISTLADEACESISSNFITVIREATECAITVNDISLEDGTTTTNICVDGVGDPLNVTTNGGTDGTESGWIITDDMNNILALPMAPPFDLDGAGDGTCLIWYALYEAGLTGLEVDNNVSDLVGCFGLSNPVTVIRESADGGMISLLDGMTTYTGTAGDIVFDVMHTTNAANLAYWYIITDADDNILAFQNSLDGNTLDLSVAPPGECHIWGYSSLGLVDPVAGENISTLADEACESISSNFITVIREATECAITVNDISLEDGTTTTNICVDGVGDPLNVTTNGGTDGTESGWIITDDMNNILALPMAPPFDLDGAGDGTCLIWYVLYEAGLTGLEVDNNVSDLVGCFGLSNPVTVIRESADGGIISLLDGTTTYTGTAGDIVFDVMHTTNASNLAYWYIITDADDNILAFQNSLDGNTLDLSVAPPGECHVWGYSSLGLVDPVAGENISTLADEACESISSNFITVIREVDCSLDLMVNVICQPGEPKMYSMLISWVSQSTDVTITDNNTDVVFNLPTSSGTITFGPFEEGAGYSYTIIDNNVDGCEITEFASAVDCTVTSVELVSFDGRKVNDGNELFWSTASEDQSAYFILERSLDGENFEVISKIKSIGNSNTRQNYNYLDQNIVQSAYYRLLEVDQVGQSKIASDIIYLKRRYSNLELISVGPTPTVDKVQIKLEAESSEEIITHVYNTIGQLIVDKSSVVNIGVNNVEIDLSKYASGIYFINILSKESGVQQISVLKN